MITVSCTGFANPGPDYFIVREVGLNPGVQRFQLGFMGCYAAIPALRMASQFCAADPRAVVLIVSIELCTLHLHPHGGNDEMLANALFADGAACAVVTGRPAPDGKRALELGTFASTLVPEGQGDMAWSIGDHGFDIVLSSYVPRIIGGAIHQLVDPILRGLEIALSDVRFWAVHPGGRAILDKVEAGLGLPAHALTASREVLRRYGNMSSATVLFVLRELWAHPDARPGDAMLTMAFGPGLTVESAGLRYVGASVDPSPTLPASGAEPAPASGGEGAI